MTKAAKRKKMIAVVIVLIILAVILGFFISRIKQAPKPYTLKVYFLKDEKLAAVDRIGNQKIGPMVVVAQALSKGPTETELKQGFYTEIPKGANILSVDKIGDMAIIDFNSELENYGGGATRVQALVSQIVYSFTELANINEVKITVNSKDEIILGGEGFVIDKPLSRSDISF